MNRRIYIYVTPYFPSPDDWRGGFSYDFVCALQRDGRYDVRVFVPGNGESYSYRGVRVQRFKERKFPTGAFPWMLERINQSSFLRALDREGLRADDVAVCHGNTRSFAIYPNAVKKSNPRCLALLHHHACSPLRLGMGRFGVVKGYSDLLYIWTKRICDRMDAHVFCSSQSAEHYDKDVTMRNRNFVMRDLRDTTFLGKLLPPLTAKRKIVCYNGYDKNIFKPLPQTRQEFVIGCIGNFFVDKRQIVLVKAFDILFKKHDKVRNAWRLRFVGSGPELSKVRKHAIRCGLGEKIDFWGEMDHSELPAAYHSMDLFVLPSISEGLSCVSLEAFACGKSVIAVEGSSFSELIPKEDWKVWLAEPDNAEDLSDKIWQYYINRPTMRLNRQMDTDTIAGEFLDEVDSLLKGVEA